MITTDTGQRRLTAIESLSFFIFSILLNAFANALTVATNLGSAIWTASAVNLAAFTHIGLGIILFAYGFIVIFLNAILLRQLNWRRVIGNLIYISPFSYLVQQFTSLLEKAGIMSLGLPARIVLDIIGVVLIGVAVSIYQRVKLILHPNDDLSYILRFDFFNGNAAIAQYVSYILPILVLLACWFLTGNLLASNIGTVISLISQGPVTGWADQHVVRRLKHRLH
ncbi:YczE/YyaS/YitT family protein [Loigolactobacillus coryniformis]|uniref:Integral membrane protein n=1 Tax=Loigolactobacillus coryniformis subsp. coryniformis CECT 5711 TaxID=1185325 RepID=J3JCA6_9LACO|nr:hypothetical protein [Loigolactobacillus coryniformis]EJN56439.1 Integral membrane protein [Loigolactobacillus coryniformis subsp. coryniformis CECT 5711]